MFAVRADQENAIYEQQTAAAAKPLNQGIKGLAPKTPANKAPPKTPFKRPLNDENAKTVGKGKQDGLLADGKGAKVDKSAFVTPAGPRTRAPLGNKTTNAKATAFRNPAPPTQEQDSAKQTSPRMRRAKIKIHDAETAARGDQEEREIEYMPPREIPLPNHPDDWPLERTYTQLEGENLTRGWLSEFSEHKDEEDEEFSDFEDKLKKAEASKAKPKTNHAHAAKKAAVVKQSAMQKATRDPLASKAPQGLTARSAASALSKPSASSTFAAPTLATKAKAPSILQSRKPASITSAPGNTRHTVAKVASNSTLGYSKGRAVSDYKRKPLADLYEAPTTSSPRPAKCNLNELFGIQDLDIKDEDADLGLSSTVRGLSLEEEEEASQVFQLDTVDV